MTRLRLLGLAFTAVLVTAVSAASAAYATDPHWTAGGSGSALATTELILSTNLTTPALPEPSQKFVNALQSIQCNDVTSMGTIFNSGGLGLDTAEITFTGCKVYKGKKTESATELKECTVETAGTSAPGTITVDAETELVWLEEGPNESGAIGDVFKPVGGSSNPFVTLNFVSTGSGSGKCEQKNETKVTGSVVARLLAGRGLEATGASVMESEEGILMFPTTAIKNYWTAGGTKTASSLKVFGTEVATQSGESLVMLSKGGSFGAV